MKTCLLALALVFGIGPATTPAGEGVSITFHPEEGSSLAKTFGVMMEAELEEFTMTMNGQEMSPEVEMSFENRQTISVTDTYLAVGEGRPTELLRTFDELTSTESKSGSMGEAEETEGSSPLDGETVRFEWDSEAEEYDVAFVDSDSDEDLLEQIEEDMDVREFLPEFEVAFGDEWELDAQLFRSLWEVGGNLRIGEDDEESSEEDSSDDAFNQAIGDNLGGTILCRFAETREDGERTLAVIEIEAELEGRGEGEEDTPEGLQTTVVRMDYDLEGELVWDLTAGHLVSFELGGEFIMAMEMAIEDVRRMLFHFVGAAEVTAEASEL